MESTTRRIRRRSPTIFRRSRVDPFDLTTLRHNSATRCPDSLDHPEAAALLGHSGPKTTGGYGKRQKRWKKKKRSSGGSGWMPTPDPVTVEVVALLFYPDEAPDTAAASPAENKSGSQMDLF